MLSLSHQGLPIYLSLAYNPTMHERLLSMHIIFINTLTTFESFGNLYHEMGCLFKLAQQLRSEESEMDDGGRSANVFI